MSLQVDRKTPSNSPLGKGENKNLLALYQGGPQGVLPVCRFESLAKHGTFLNIWYLDFEFVSDFEIRISNLIGVRQGGVVRHDTRK